MITVRSTESNPATQARIQIFLTDSVHEGYDALDVIFDAPLQSAHEDVVVAVPFSPIHIMPYPLPAGSLASSNSERFPLEPCVRPVNQRILLAAQRNPLTDKASHLPNVSLPQYASAASKSIELSLWSCRRHLDPSERHACCASLSALKQAKFLSNSRLFARIALLLLFGCAHT